jgi:hypothetical protein
MGLHLAVMTNFGGGPGAMSGAGAFVVLGVGGGIAGSGASEARGAELRFYKCAGFDRRQEADTGTV